MQTSLARCLFVALLACGVPGRPVCGDDAEVHGYLRQLGGASTSEAEAALSQRGRDGLAAVARGLDQIPETTAAWDALERYLTTQEGMAAWSEFMGVRGEWPAKRRGRLLRRLGGGVLAASGGPPSVALKTVETLEPREFPRALVQIVKPALSLAAPLDELVVESVGADLVVRPPGQAGPLVIRDGKPKFFACRARNGMERKVVAWKETGVWLCAPAEARRGKVGELVITIHDSDLDGAWDGAGDYVRLGSGGYVPNEEGPLFSDPLGVLWLVAVEGTGVDAKVRAVRAPALAGASQDELAGLARLNGWRSQLGLAPVLPDPRRSKACVEHAARVREVGSKAAREPAGTAGAEEVIRRGVILYQPTAPLGIDEMRLGVATRFHLLGDHREWVGLGAVEGARVERAPGYCVVWGSDGVSPAPGRHVLVPAPGQRQVPRQLRPDSRPPDLDMNYFATPRGHAVSISSARGTPIVKTFELRLRGKGPAVEADLFTGARLWRAGQSKNYHSAILVPKKPLVAGAEYEVSCILEESAPSELRWTFWTE